MAEISRAFVENVEKSSCLPDILVWTRKPQVCLCHECVTRNHQPSFNPLFKHDKNSTHKLWGCVKYKIRNEITIQCVSQFSEVRHEFQFHYAVVNQIAKFEPKL